MRIRGRVSRRRLLTTAAIAGAMLVVGAGSAAATARFQVGPTANDTAIAQNSMRMLAEGRHTFRFDTFGDEAFWGDTLQLHLAIAGAANGGIGGGVSPRTALAVGLKVDVEALPRSLRDALAQGQVNLDDPATTLALLQLDAVVGLTGVFDAAGSFRSIGIQCALCHSTVDNSFAPGIGHRL